MSHLGILKASYIFQFHYHILHMELHHFVPTAYGCEIYGGE